MKRHVIAVLIGLSLLATGGCLDSNDPPTASFTRSPASGAAPLAVFFDATESEDPDGTIVSYAWDFGAGDSAAGISVTHTFESVGTFAVTLTVADDRGKTDRTLRNVDVTSPDVLPSIGTEVGQRSPDFVLSDVRTGELRSLASFRGYVVLVEFWRSTCSSCRSSMPAIEDLRMRFASEGVVVVLVSQDVTAEEARVLFDGQGYDEFIAVFDEGEATRDLYDVELIPWLFVIDRQGIVRHVDHPIRIRDRHITPWL